MTYTIVHWLFFLVGVLLGVLIMLSVLVIVAGDLITMQGVMSCIFDGQGGFTCMLDDTPPAGAVPVGEVKP